MRSILLAAVFFTTLVAGAAQSLTTLTMLSAATTTTSSANFAPYGPHKTFYAKGTTSTGAGAATIIFEAANATSSVATDWVALCTVSLVLSTTSASDGCAVDSTWKFVRARISAISGTDATVTAIMGSESAGR